MNKHRLNQHKADSFTRHSRYNAGGPRDFLMFIPFKIKGKMNIILMCMVESIQHGLYLSLYQHSQEIELFMVFLFVCVFYGE